MKTDSFYLDHFFNLEKELPVEKITLGSLPVWPILRIMYFFKLRNLHSQSAASLGSEKPWRRWNRIKSVHQNIYLLFFPKKYWCISDSTELKIIDGQLQNKLFYKLFEILGRQNFLYIEKYISEVSTKNRTHPDPVANTLIDILAYLLSYFMPLQTPSHIEILSQLEGKIGFQIHWKKTLKLFKSYSWLYSILLKWHKPQALFISDSYGISQFSAISAAKKQNIPVIEFQHGIINSAHPAYRIEKKVADSSWLYPGYLFTFGTSVLESLKDKSYIPIEQVISVGHPYLDYLKKQTLPPKRTQKKQILITLQWVDEVQVIEFIKGLAQKLPNYEFILLPRTFNDQIHQQNQLPANAFYERQKDFYTLVRECDIHVTTYSTTALEASCFQKPNILLNFDNMARIYFENMLKDQAWNAYVTTEAEFINALEKALLEKPPTTDKVFNRSDYTKSLQDALTHALPSMNALG